MSEPTPPLPMVDGENGAGMQPAAPIASPVPAFAPEDSAFYTPIFPAALLTPLMEMGFTEARCVRALHATGGVAVDPALQWLFEHAEDADIDTPLRLPIQNAAAASSSNNAPAGSSASPSSASSLMSAYPGAPMKVVFCVRGDLHMRTGKIAAQVAHAAVGTVLSIQRSESKATAKENSALLKQWLREGQAKVVLGVANEREMLELQRAAARAGLHTHIIADAGRTQVEAGSQTVLAVGPGPVPAIDEITGHLKLI